MARFFGNVFWRWMGSRAVQAASLVLCAGLMVYLCVRASQMRPSRSIAIPFFPPGSNYARSHRLALGMGREEAVAVTLAWGLRLRNMTGCARDHFKCLGEARYDPDFDLNPAPAQTALLRLCQRLQSDADLRRRLHVRSAAAGGAARVRCFLADMQRDMEFVRRHRTVACADGGGLDLTLPIDRAKALRLFACRPDLYGGADAVAGLLDAGFDRFFEAALTFWMRGVRPGREAANTSRVQDYSAQQLLTAWAPPLVWPRRYGLPREGRYYGGRLVYAAVSVDTTLTPESDSYVTGAAVRDAWEVFMAESLARMPAGLRGGFQCTMRTPERSLLNLWEWFGIQEALWHNARNGFLLGLLAVALPILLLATRNFVLAGAGVLCLVCTSVAAVAVARDLGWSLGISESINMALVTGLAVDYIVHFIEAYHLSERPSRAERVREMLACAGGAVTSGVVTTVGATGFLFGSRLLFFIQFGTFLCTSIGFSFFFSLFLLTPLLMLVGPEGRQWSVGALVAWLRALLSRGRSRKDARRNRTTSMTPLAPRHGSTSDSQSADPTAPPEGQSPELTAAEGQSLDLTATEGHSPELTAAEGQSLDLTATEGHSPELTAAEGQSLELTATEGQSPNLTAAEGQSMDLTATEGQSPDLTAAEGQSMDLTATEGQSPDLTATEGQSLDLTATEGQSPDLTAAEGQSPDLTATEGQSPDLTATEGQSLDLTATESQSPDLTAAEGQSPDLTATESQSPDLTAAEGQSLDLTVTEGQSLDLTAAEGQSLDLIATESQPPHSTATEGQSPESTATESQSLDLTAASEDYSHADSRAAGSRSESG